MARIISGVARAGAASRRPYGEMQRRGRFQISDSKFRMEETTNSNPNADSNRISIRAGATARVRSLAFLCGFLIQTEHIARGIGESRGDFWGVCADWLDDFAAVGYHLF